MTIAASGRGGFFSPAAKPVGATAAGVPSIHELLRRLEAMREQHQKVEALVNGAQLLNEVILLLAPLLAFPEPLYNLRQAAEVLGYSQSYLGRLVREGKIPNHGSKGRPRVRLSECRMVRGPQRRTVAARAAA